MKMGSFNKEQVWAFIQNKNREGGNELYTFFFFFIQIYHFRYKNFITDNQAAARISLSTRFPDRKSQVEPGKRMNWFPTGSHREPLLSHPSSELAEAWSSVSSPAGAQLSNWLYYEGYCKEAASPLSWPMLLLLINYTFHYTIGWKTGREKRKKEKK